MGSLRAKAAIVGIGESELYKRGGSPDAEVVLAMKAIKAACASAGINPRQIDGFASFADDRNSSVRLAAAFGIEDLRWSTMQWGGGGGGGSGAVQAAATAVATGCAERVVVFRSLAQGQFGRFGQGSRADRTRGGGAYAAPYGLLSPAQTFAMKYQRFIHEHGTGWEAQKAVALASYHHAQQNPRAVMHGRPLDPETYDASRWISEPWRLFDCCLENDCAAAVVVAPAERANDHADRPAYILAAAQGAAHRDSASVHNAPLYASASFSTVAPRLWAMAGVGPGDVDVTQSYENFTGGVVMSLVEHGFCAAEQVDDVLSFANLIAPGGRFPLNTSGGNLAEAYIHGLGLVTEAVRQLRGESCNQVPEVDVALVSSGPMVQPCSSLVLGSEATR